MGLRSQEKQQKLYFMSYMNKKEENGKEILSPHFRVSLRDTDGTTKKCPDETGVSGYLVATAHGEYEWPKDSKKMIPKIILFLVDGEDKFKVEMNARNSIARSLMNTIIGTPDLSVVKLSVYVKNDHPNIYITNNDEKCTWKYDYEKDLKPLVREVEDPQNPGQMVKVYHAVDAKLMNDWIALEPVIAKRAKEQGWVQAEAAPVQNTTAAPGSLQDEFNNMAAPPVGEEPPFFSDASSSDDLPF